MSTPIPTDRELEKLFINNSKFEAIRSHLARFNPIKTMGMERMEIRHSAILGWLLDPQQTHGLGDSFLRAFLSEALKNHDFSDGPNALELSQADLMDAEVRREWRHIDLLVISRNNRWVFVIENKFDSSQHSNQLTRYMDFVEKAFLDGETLSHARGIMLSLSEEEPDDPRYAAIIYDEICRLVEQRVLGANQPLKPEVETFVQHYLDIILEATGMSVESKKMEQLARELYRDNKRVLDFIIENGKTTDFSLACETVFGEDTEYLDEIDVDGQKIILNEAGNRTLSFLPKSWFEAFGTDKFWWHGCEYFWAGFPLIVWMELTARPEGIRGQLRLHAEVGPLSDHAFRKELIEKISMLKTEDHTLRIGFQRGATDEGKRYSRFFKKSGFPVDDIHDHEQIAKVIKKAVKSFKKEIDAVAKVLPQFIEHGKAEASK